jgi:shikimate dehydrogenase
MNKIRQYGLIGEKLKHSFSPKYFDQKFKKENITDAQYRIYEMEDLSEVFVLFEEGISGLNVTIPYKEKVIPLLDKLVGDAKEINAVNTIKPVGNQLHGYNTDTYGFRESVRPFISNMMNKNALILGTGGASKAVEFVLKEFGFITFFVSRSKGEYSYDNLMSSGLSDFSIIVNTTPLGMFPNVNNKPLLPYNTIGPQHLLIDLIYNPEKTLFLEEGHNRGAKVLNGLNMLKLQAVMSWQIWNS